MESTNAGATGALIAQRRREKGWSQAELAEKILPLLTQEEQDVFRRGRNANVHSIPAHASRAQYQQATALEALLGYLYLQGRRDRVNELFCRMMEGE